jgi:hypothetical protein
VMVISMEVSWWVGRVAVAMTEVWHTMDRAQALRGIVTTL